MKVIPDGFMKYENRRGDKRFKPVIRIGRVPYMSRKSFGMVSQAIAYGEKWAQRWERLHMKEPA